jgi:hypothetical protein
MRNNASEWVDTYAKAAEDGTYSPRELRARALKMLVRSVHLGVLLPILNCSVGGDGARMRTRAPNPPMMRARTDREIGRLQRAEEHSKHAEVIFRKQTGAIMSACR